MCNKKSAILPLFLMEKWLLVIMEYVLLNAALRLFISLQVSIPKKVRSHQSSITQIVSL